MSKFHHGLERGFEPMTSIPPRHLPPPTAMASVLTIWPPPIRHKRTDTNRTVAHTGHNSEPIRMGKIHHSYKNKKGILKWKWSLNLSSVRWRLSRKRWIKSMMTSSNGNISALLAKGQRRGALMFSLICVWINGWVNNRDAGDLRRHRTHYDVIVMHKCVTHNYACKLDHHWFT